MKFIFAWPKSDVLREAFTGADLVHLQFPFYLSIKSLAIAKKMNVPVISAFHVQPENICFNVGVRSQAIINFLYRFFVKRVYNRTLAVICPSPFAESVLRRYGLKVPAHVVSNGIMPRFRPGRYKREPEWKDRFVILCVGRLARDKRHDVLIEAITRSKYRDRIQFVAAGQGPRKEYIEGLASRLPVPARIGYVSDEDLLRYLNTADLYVHPSEVELESMSVLEAMACGLPVLISDARTSAASQFAVSEQFLFRSNAPAHLAARIDYWIEHPAELKKARRVYLEKASHYHIEKSVDVLEGIYADYLHRN